MKLGEDYYFNKKGLMVLTEAHHLKRGICCKSSPQCENCPYRKKREMKHLRRFSNIDPSVDIDAIIDYEIEKSENQFMFKILPEDQELEKAVIKSVFNRHWDEIKKCGESDESYSTTIRKIIELVSDQLEDRMRYYFNNTPPGETKTRYNCHLQSVVVMLFLRIVGKK